MKKILSYISFIILIFMFTGCSTKVEFSEVFDDKPGNVKSFGSIKNAVDNSYFKAVDKKISDNYISTLVSYTEDNGYEQRTDNKETIKERFADVKILDSYKDANSVAFTLSVPKDFFCYDSYISTEVGGYALDDMTVASAKSDNAVKHYKFCCGMFDESTKFYLSFLENVTDENSENNNCIYVFDITDYFSNQFVKKVDEIDVNKTVTLNESEYTVNSVKRTPGCTAVYYNVSKGDALMNPIRAVTETGDKLSGKDSLYNGQRVYYIIDNNQPNNFKLEFYNYDDYARHHDENKIEIYDSIDISFSK